MTALKCDSCDTIHPHRCRTAAPVRFPRTKPTWRMTRIELAKVVADHVGVHAHTGGGGWLYTKADRPLTQGWENYADRLERRGIIEVGAGIHWSAADGWTANEGSAR